MMYPKYVLLSVGLLASGSLFAAELVDPELQEAIRASLAEVQPQLTDIERAMALSLSESEVADQAIIESSIKAARQIQKAQAEEDEMLAKVIDQSLSDDDDNDETELARALRLSLALGLAAQNTKQPAAATTSTAQTTQKAAPVSIDCPICMDTKKPEELCYLSCMHTYCTECLKGIVKGALAEKTTAGLRCPNPECKLEFDETEVRNIAANDRELLAHYSEVATQELLAKNQTAIHCPTLNCNGVFFYEGQGRENVQCPSCHNTYCSECKTPHNQQTSCKQAASERKDDKENAQWKMQNTMPCPRCNTAIEKNAGCDYMKCTKCLSEFCWNCREVGVPGVALHHYCPHPRQR